MNFTYKSLQTAASGAEKEKGGAPEGARQEINSMLNVAQKAPLAQVDIAPFHSQSQSKKLGVWLDTLVERAKTKPVSQVVTLTPDLAAVFLERNPANRKIKPSVVEIYAHDIARGAWVFNGQPIIISDTGELNDGQHRCSAVVEADKPIEVLLIVGIKRDTRTTLDQGRARTAGDFLSMEGATNTNVLAASANFLWQYRNRGAIRQSGSSSATKSEVLEIVRDNPGLTKSVAFVQVTAAASVGGPSILAFAHFVFKSTRHRDDADFFIHSLMSGAGLKNGSPILYARNRLINERGRLKPREKAEILFKAWNAWKRGENITRIVLGDGLLPVLED